MIGFQNRLGKRLSSKSSKIRVTRKLQGLWRVARINNGALSRKRWKICVIKQKKVMSLYEGFEYATMYFE